MKREPVSGNVALAICAVGALGSSDPSQVLALVDDEILYESPFYPSSPTVRSRQAFTDLIHHVHLTFSRVAFEVVDAFAADDAERVVVECRGNSVVASTSAPYRNHYLMMLRFRGGLIVEWREFSNPLVYSAAMDAT